MFVFSTADLRPPVRESFNYMWACVQVGRLLITTALLFASLSMCQSVSCSDLEITTSLTKRAPEPRLSIGVSQDGQKFTRDLTVKSVSRERERRQVNLYINLDIYKMTCNVLQGTPLTMEINLDEDSAPVYGLGVNYLDVTDTHTSSETLVFKGCVRHGH